MPTKGFKSITLHEECYDSFESMYHELKKLDKVPPGITSFSGYVNYRMSKYVSEKQSLRKLANKINTDLIPEKFLAIKTINNPNVSTPRSN